jgi:uncharacterized protein YgbK (DUF1537 family)
MARRLGWAAAEIVSRQSVGGLVLTGGETAIQVCQALGASGLRLLAEVEPGVPVSQLVGGPHAGLLVCTKAGAFGDERTLWRAVEWLKEP